MTDKDITIKCPNCSYEYLPGELYLPDHFLGQPKEIERTIEGKVDVFWGLRQDLDTNYICDKCGKPFKVHANITFTTEVDTLRDFNSSYSVPLYKDRISLSE